MCSKLNIKRRFRVVTQWNRVGTYICNFIHNGRKLNCEFAGCRVILCKQCVAMLSLTFFGKKIFGFPVYVEYEAMLSTLVTTII